MDKLRLMFTKTGRSVYISHLDLMRTMQRAFMRAELPLGFSEGFNPHAQISILLPMSVGTASVCELMDFRLSGDCELAAVPALLTRALPEGIEVLEAYQGLTKPRDLKWLRVSGCFEYDSADTEKAAAVLRELFSRESLVITKRTKRGEGESDIKEAIHEISFVPEEKCLRLEAVISAQEPTLNPELLASAVRQLRPEWTPDFASFCRMEVYGRDFQVFR